MTNRIQRETVTLRCPACSGTGSLGVVWQTLTPSRKRCRTCGGKTTQATLRRASEKDVPGLHKLGLTLAELRVSATEPFMTEEELEASVADTEDVFVVAEREDKPRELVGFAYAHISDVNSLRAEVRKQACFVYLAVAPALRGAGLGAALYDAVTTHLKKRGVSYVYAWAHPRSGVVGFLKDRGYAKGKPAVWMDRRL